jgi:L-fucose mutarotase
MLKGIDRHLSADLVHALMRMGHGDELLICDVNHPAATIAKATTHGRVIDMAGCDIPTGAAAILTLMPLDTFVPAPVTRMEVVGDPSAQMPVFGRIQALERFAFYAAAERAFCVVRTSDPGPYGCFLMKMGVV